MNMLAGMLAVKKIPVFEPESHGEKIARLSGFDSALKLSMEARRVEIKKLVKSAPLFYNAKKLAGVLGVTKVTIAKDVRNINGITKSTRDGYRSQYVYSGK